MKKNAPQKTKIVLFTGYSCNNNCRFCINSNKRELLEKTTDELIKEIYLAKKKKADIVEIIGGESTIRHDYTHLISVAKKIGIKEVLSATNGKIFSDFSAAKKIVNSGISGLIFSLHGHNSKTHDYLTRSKGSFNELIKGIENLKKLGFKSINGNTTIVKPNMRFLPRIAELYAKYKIRNVEYIFVDPTYGGAYDNFKELVPKISKASVFMRKAVDIGINCGYKQWKVRYVPLCYFNGYERHISEINERILFFTEHWAPDFKNTNALVSRQIISRKKTARCKGCAVYNACEGIWAEYIKRYGDSELKAVK
ncbi:MAG: radical SAM protein [Elusimicrobia bacterium]|nr:radical SAM protein [Elusimicrobiota bacterium]